MLKHEWIDRICAGALALAILLCLCLMSGDKLGVARLSASPPYAEKLFGQGQVHQVDIQMAEADWLEMLERAAYKEYYPCEVVIDGERVQGAGIRCKGNNSLNQTQKYGSFRYSMKLEFDHYQAGASYHGLDKLSLNACFEDNARMKEFLTMDMMRQMGVPAPLTSYANVTVNGAAWGLFVAIEEIEEAFARRNFGSDHGRLYKPDYRSIDHENLDVGLCYIDDDPESYDNIFRKAKFPIGDADKRRLIASLKQLSSGEKLEEVLEVDALLRYFVVQTFVVNLDSYLGSTGHNYYLYEEKGRLSMLPWDYNLAYATYALGSGDRIDDPTKYVNHPIDTPADGETMKNRPAFHQLMQNDEYFIRYHEYYQQFLDEYVYSGYLEQRIEAARQMIAPYVQRDPTSFCSYQDFHLAADTLKTFCLLRAQSVQGQLDGAIPSTIAGQSVDQSGFVDASAISIADLGDFEDMAEAVWRVNFE